MRIRSGRYAVVLLFDGRIRGRRIRAVKLTVKAAESTPPHPTARESLVYSVIIIVIHPERMEPWS